ncbi:uncharacterized protein B0H18DRAFT_207030 [Fomitopsis serialis]|uniref:uncharacterized protein n=1 Tax=Fomitopsis serialis TaxID=139415 RepID=UPI002007A4AF|nr:uncharacterized protein B0H18DRAFT_207030 [Neoantrodia serialis]KAH9929322.1 hypothetical protein B0H18DRAFT_207030 [Neoantrodia serialis]
MRLEHNARFSLEAWADKSDCEVFLYIGCVGPNGKPRRWMMSSGKAGADDLAGEIKGSPFIDTLDAYVLRRRSNIAIEPSGASVSRRQSGTQTGSRTGAAHPVLDDMASARRADAPTSKDLRADMKRLRRSMLGDSVGNEEEAATNHYAEPRIIETPQLDTRMGEASLHLKTAQDASCDDRQRLALKSEGSDIWAALLREPIHIVTDADRAKQEPVNANKDRIALTETPQHAESSPRGKVHRATSPTPPKAPIATNSQAQPTGQKRKLETIDLRAMLNETKRTKRCGHARPSTGC